MVDISDCGVARTSIQRIIGGNRSVEYEFPWQVAITNGGSFCGGVIIGTRHVVTAAHCVSQG